MRLLLHVLLTILCPGVLSEASKPHIIVIFIDDAAFGHNKPNRLRALLINNPNQRTKSIAKAPCKQVKIWGCEILGNEINCQCRPQQKGWNDFGYQGSDQIKTPNIDALAYSGMILNRHYVLPSCTPSRTALLTGYHPIRTGMQGFPLKAGENRNLPLSFKLKPERLKDLGYNTHMVGKWHLGYETYNHVPNHRGFDSFFGYYNGFIDYYRYDYNQSLDSVTATGESFRGYDLHHNDDVYRVENYVYATKLFTDRAREIIERHNTSEPLYLYLSHLATHTGNDEFMGMQMPEDANVNKTYSYIKEYGRRAFAGCMEELDRSVGVVIHELEKKRMLENSIILVMSDNGAHSVSVDMAPNWGSNWPLSGTKFTLYEGGVRGAALIWSPLLPKGFINYGFMHISDWLPTLYSAAGGDIRNLGEIDGIDQWEALKRITTVKRDNLLLNIDDKTGAEGIIINNRWKVIKGGFAGYAKYDLHWGREKNIAPNPEHDPKASMSSVTGNIIRSQPEYQSVLSQKRMLDLRWKATVKCNVPEYDVSHNHGYVDKSSDFRCPDFCVFDLLNDPCELHDMKNQEIIKIGMKFLNEYKKNIVKQTVTHVDPESDPDLFGGVWMPWNAQVCAKSIAEEFTSQYLNVSLFITLSWYSLRKLRH